MPRTRSTWYSIDSPVDFIKTSINHFRRITYTMKNSKADLPARYLPPRKSVERLQRVFLCVLFYGGIFARKRAPLRRDARKQYACAISISELPSPLLHIQLAGVAANQHVASECE